MRANILLVALLSLSCRPAADEGFTLLFLGRSPAARVGRYSWAPDAPHSRLIAFDGDLHVVRTVTDPRISSPVAVAPYPDGRLLITERTGEGVVFDTAGKPVREWESPFPASLYATEGTRILASRSPYFVQFIAEDGSVPLLWLLDTLGHRRQGLGIAHVPDIRYLAQLENSGPTVLSHDVVYFAPLAHDEVLRLDGTGSPGWHSGRLYVLGGQDSAATRLRLDVLNRETGQIVAARVLGTPATAIAVNRHGRIRVLDPAALIAQTPTQGRDPFAPSFALPDLTGKPARLADYRGKVTLVNFWASWCAPCREEFPHMAELYSEFKRADFDIAAISDDVSGSKMRAFVREFRPPFPILVGGGRMKAAYHYRGLPYSVLLDRHGRVIERFFGFGGESEFRHLRDLIAREIDADSAAAR